MKLNLHPNEFYPKDVYLKEKWPITKEEKLSPKMNEQVD